jgi:LAO/AO transport system kinase
MAELWGAIGAAHDRLRSDGSLDELRAQQARSAMWSEVTDELLDRLRGHPGVRERLAELESAVDQGQLSPTAAAHDVLEHFLRPSP